jgi:drug/metabolite transporter (DMT)-like permease
MMAVAAFFSRYPVASRGLPPHPPVRDCLDCIDPKGLEGSNMSHRLRLVLAFACVYIVWGSTYLAIRMVVDSAPPLVAMGTRFLAAGGLLYAWVRLRGGAAPTVRQWRGAALVGALLFLAGNGGVAWAEAQGLPSGTAAMLVATMPLWLTSFARLSGERQAPTAWLGLAIGFVGTALLVRPQGGASLPALAIVFGAAGWALGSLLSRRIDAPADGRTSAAMQMLAGGTWLVLAGLLGGEQPPALAEVALSSWIAWLFLVVLGSIVAFSAYGWLLRNVAPAKVGTYAYVNPVVAIVLGTFVGETIEPATFLAMMLVVTGVVVTIGSRSRPARIVLPTPPSTDAHLVRAVR